MHETLTDAAAMFAYAYDRHHTLDIDRRKVLREVLVESMIDWLIRRHPDAAAAIYAAAKLKAPGGFVAIGRQTRVERDGRRTDIDLEFERGRAIVELKVGAGFNEGQLQSYANELGRTRRRHSDAHADLFVLTRKADRDAAEDELKTVRFPPGVRTHVLDFHQVANQDERWEIISRSTDELVSPRQPVAGTPDVFLDLDIAKWATGSLREVAQIGSEERSSKLREAAKRQFELARLHGEFGPRVPSFSVDKRNVEALFFSYLDSEFARVEIDPLVVRDPGWGALVWAQFPKVTVNDGWMYFPKSRPTAVLRERAGAAVEAVWQVLWVVTQRLRADEWETTKDQPAVTTDGLLAIKFESPEQLGVVIWFDPRPETWATYGPISLRIGDTDLTDVADGNNVWHLPRDLGTRSLDDWILRAADLVVGEISKA